MNRSQLSHEHLALVSFVLLVPLGLLGWLSLQSARAGYLDMIGQLNECQLLANEITSLRQERSVASRSTLESPLTNDVLLTILTQAEIDQTKLAQIERLPPSPIPNTEYVRDDAIVRLTNATLEEVVKMIVAADRSDQGISATSLNLAWPRGSASSSSDAEVWNVDVVLTHLVYDATSQSR